MARDASPYARRVGILLAAILICALVLLRRPAPTAPPVSPAPSAVEVPPPAPAPKPPVNEEDEPVAPASFVSGIAAAMGGLPLRCDLPDDMAELPSQALTGALLPPGDAAWPTLLGEIADDALILTVPPRAGEARIRLEQLGALRVRWSVVGEVAVCEQARLEAAQGGVHGLVLDAASAPLPSAAVRACAGETRADETGAFYLALPVGAPCELRAEWVGATSEGQSEAVVVTPRGDRDLVDLRLTVDLRERETPPPPDAAAEAQRLRDYCRNMNEIIDSRPTVAARLREIYRDRLDRCDRALRALEAGGDPTVLMLEAILDDPSGEAAADPASAEAEQAPAPPDAAEEGQAD